MTVRVNLLPADYELRYQRTRRLRRWVTIGCIILALQVPAFITIRRMGTQARELQRSLELAGLQHQTIQTRLAALAAQQVEVDRQIELADRLSRKHRWSELFETVAACLPETAILTKLDTDPPRGGGDGNPTPRMRAAVHKDEGGSVEGVAAGVVIGGVAMDHDSVAVFLRNLNATGKVGRCSLDSTMRQPFLEGDGVSFTVRAQW